MRRTRREQQRSFGGEQSRFGGVWVDSFAVCVDFPRTPMNSKQITTTVIVVCALLAAWLLWPSQSPQVNTTVAEAGQPVAEQSGKQPEPMVQPSGPFIPPPGLPTATSLVQDYGLNLDEAEIGQLQRAMSHHWEYAHANQYGQRTNPAGDDLALGRIAAIIGEENLWMLRAPNRGAGGAGPGFGSR